MNEEEFDRRINSLRKQHDDLFDRVVQLQQRQTELRQKMGEIVSEMIDLRIEHAGCSRQEYILRALGKKE